MCNVEVKGESREVASCARQVTDGMEVYTHTLAIESERSMNLRMLAREYPLDAYKKYPDKPFHRLAAKYGLTDDDFRSGNGHRIDDSHTYISVDMSRCVECYRCVRICKEVQGQFVWQMIGRGEATQITPDSFDSFGASSCVSCGA